MVECFTIFRNKIEGRIDPSFYRPKFIELVKKFYDSKFELKTLNELSVKIKSGTTPKAGGPDYTTKENGVPFIRSGDINERNIIDFDKVLYLKKEIHKTKLKSSQLKKGDLLIAIVGATIGKVSVYNYEKEANINQAIASVRLKKEVLPEYIKIFLLSHLGQMELERVKRPVARANLNLEEIGNLKILLPPLEIQRKIVKIMENSYNKKEKQEAKCEQLLSSLDELILKKLNIKVPEEERKITFVVSKNEIEGRLDPYYYNPNFAKKLYSLKASEFEILEFGNLMLDLKNGIELRKYSNEGLRYLRVTDLGKYGINNKDPKFVNIENIPSKIKLTINDILISRSGSLGLILAANEQILDYVISSHIFKVKINTEKILVQYLEAFLRSSLGQFQFFQKNNGGIVPEINQSALKEIKIIIPPLEIQQNIVNEVKLRMNEVNKLELKSKKISEEAMIQIEKILLGD